MARWTKPSTLTKWGRLIRQDMLVASSRGSPWTIFCARSSTACWKRSAMESSTRIRNAPRQTCPELSNCSTARLTARSKSASANTTSGDFPPSSNDSGTILAAAARAITPAVGTDPVNDSRRMPGWAVSGAPASVPVPWTTLNTPSGRPASLVMSASSEAVSGAHSGGFATTVFPEASAGPIRQVASISGAFHGVMIAATPAGS